MYVCGPTVYDLLHIGNFRGAVFFHFVSQWLKHLNHRVSYIYNFTDVDDKIITRAKKEHTSPEALTNKYIKEFEKDYQALNLSPHSHNPRATHFINPIISFVEKLIKAGRAYHREGDVFFHVPSFKGYGTLSGRKTLKDVLSGARVSPDHRKKDPRDFALWKASPAGEMGWTSPWGRGRPGWHIECSTMIHSLTGGGVDIHGGGSDLIFPHHENEKAQSEALGVKPFVRYWMHHNMFTFEGEKMAKSSGNLITMRDFLKQYGGEVFKFLVLSSHYRSPVSVSPKTLLQALQTLCRVYTFLKTPLPLKSSAAGSSDPATALPRGGDGLSSLEQEWEQAINDDFNTPKAFALIFSQIRKLNDPSRQNSDPREKQQLKNTILRYGKMMSLFQEPPALFLKNMDDLFLKNRGLKREDIDHLIRLRWQARKNKNFRQADELKQKLLKLQIEIQDLADGSTHWQTLKDF